MLILFILFFTSLTQTAASSRDFSISLEPTWQDLDAGVDKSIQFGGKWILAGSITFKKRAKDTIRLEKINLKWHGPELENLSGSLYKKRNDKKFLPIEENIIADGAWQTSNQTLFFRFPSHEYLDAVNTFYIVLTIPGAQEEIMRTGYFSLEEQCLPTPYKSCIYHNKLAYNSHQLTVSH